MKDWETQQRTARILAVGSCIVASFWSQLEVPALAAKMEDNSLSLSQSVSPTEVGQNKVEQDKSNSADFSNYLVESKLVESKLVENKLAENYLPTNNLSAIASPELSPGSIEFSPSELLIGQNEGGVTPVEMEYIPSVSELSDVKPTDWAYQALKSLVERYRVIAGDTNGKFRGNQPLTRYEFASALATTFSAVQDLLANAISDEYVRQDAIIIQRLRREFAKNLADLEQRIDRTEIKNAELTANQFSTTTKLKGQTIVAVTGGTNASNTIIARSRLSLQTSFQGRDYLVTELEGGNNGNDAIGQEQVEGLDLLGSQGIFADGSGLKYAQFSPDLRLRKLAYTFNPGSDISVTVGAKLSPRDFIDKNIYANNEAVDFSSGLFLNNPLIVQNPIDQNGGAGIAVNWQPQNRSFSARGLYIGANSNISNNGGDNGGLFGDNRQASLEVEFQPLEKLKLKLQYTNASVNEVDINAIGVNAEYRLNRNAGIFGRIGLGRYEGFNTTLNRDFNAHPLSWSVGIGLRNVVIPTTFAGVAIGQPFVTGDVGDATQTNFEAFYNLPLNDNISVTPIFSVVANPDNDSSNGMVWQSSLRTVFSF